MRAFAFAWRTLVRQPARAALAIVGVAAAGALLLDMLLLSDGLVVSMRDLLERTGWDIRVTSTGEAPRQGPRILSALAAREAIAALPSVRDAVSIRVIDTDLVSASGTTLPGSLQAAGGGTPPWTVLRGSDARGAAAALALAAGSRLTLRASCASGDEALPAAEVRVAGVAAFPFEIASEHTLGATSEALGRLCGGVEAADQADLILVRSAEDPAATAAAIGGTRPELRALTNEDMVGRLEQNGFTYFRQISAVLTAVTLAFAALLITVLLTVSVNQRLGEIAALRALGFSRRRVVADVLAESTLIVGIGGLASVPLGIVLARWLDTILKGMPGIPTELHFFVFEQDTLGVHLALLAATAMLAALYPMVVVSRLPIAATLRNEITE